MNEYELQRREADLRMVLQQIREGSNLRIARDSSRTYGAKVKFYREENGEINEEENEVESFIIEIDATRASLRKLIEEASEKIRTLEANKALELELKPSQVTLYILRDWDWLIHTMDNNIINKATGKATLVMHGKFLKTRDAI